MVYLPETSGRSSGQGVKTLPRPDGPARLAIRFRAEVQPDRARASGITGPWPGGYWWAGRAWSHHQNHRRPLAHGSPAKWGKRSARPSTRPATRPGSGPTWAPWARGGLIRGGPGRYGPQAKQILMVMNDFFLLMGRYRCPTNEKGVLYRKIRRNTIDDIANNEPEWNARCLNILRWGIADGDGDTYMYITSDS